jgi:methylthioribose-1-phosphate isomerase
LPHEERVLHCTTAAEVADAIRRLAVRGAPLLGIAGGYGLALAAYAASGEPDQDDQLRSAATMLADARPTAVNLPAAVGRVQAAAVNAADPYPAALAAARAIEREDAAASAAIARHGLPLVPAGARVLTHCNTGRLVSGGEGTAFAIVLAAHRAGRLAHLWVDETRPLLQGARLTAYEAAAAGIPHSVLTDAAAGSLLASGQVDLVLVGADRIAADGSVANKVGTYPLAVLAARHGVPFLVAAPLSTVDLDTPSGSAIPVEQRSAAEVLTVAGRPIAPTGSAAYNPAFDVTPPDLLTALVTERGVLQPVDAQGLAAHCRMEPISVSP